MIDKIIAAATIVGAAIGLLVAWMNPPL